MENEAARSVCRIGLDRIKKRLRYLWGDEMLRLLSTMLAAVLIGGCASSPGVPEAARAELAPTGKLRAGMNLSNELFTKQDTGTGELRGVAVDVMRALASRLD